MNEYITAVW